MTMMVLKNMGRLPLSRTRGFRVARASCMQRSQSPKQPPLQQQPLRWNSSSVADAWVYEEHGGVAAVLRCKQQPQPPSHLLQHNQVRVEMLAAPLNPSDFNMVEGVYSYLPPVPAVGGNEGVARVVEVGSSSTGLCVGDYVIPSQYGFGTWRREAICAQDELLKINSATTVPLQVLATIAVNPCTAYRMLRDFVPLVTGDTIVQNGANSGVGQAVIQLARVWGLRTINIIRDRSDLEACKDILYSLGADVVVTEEEVKAGCLKGEERAKLALNCVGGQSSAQLAKSLAFGGKMVTYGGMSRRPVTLPTGLLIFQDITSHGYWMSRWVLEHSGQERLAMIQDILELSRANKFTVRAKWFAFEDLLDGVSYTQAGKTMDKALISFQD